VDEELGKVFGHKGGEQALPKEEGAAHTLAGEGMPGKGGWIADSCRRGACLEGAAAAGGRTQELALGAGVSSGSSNGQQHHKWEKQWEYQWQHDRYEQQ